MGEPLKGLPQPAPREPLHTRRYDFRGFRRDDGMFDFNDTKITALAACSLPGFLYNWYRPDGRLSQDEVAQELAQYWGLHLIGLDPAWHPLHGPLQRLSGRNRDTARRISEAHTTLWTHFAAQRGPAGWMLLPPHSDDRLEATALSPEKRARQIQRADYWIRTANLLRNEFRGVLLRPDPHARDARVTDHQTLQGMLSGYDDSRYAASSVLESVPGSIL